MGRLAQRSTGRLGYLDVDDGGEQSKHLHVLQRIVS